MLNVGLLSIYTCREEHKKYKSLQIFLIGNILSQNKNIKTFITVGFHLHESTVKFTVQLLAFSSIDQ